LTTYLIYRSRLLPPSDVHTHIHLSRATATPTCAFWILGALLVLLVKQTHLTRYTILLFPPSTLQLPYLARNFFFLLASNASKSPPSSLSIFLVHCIKYRSAAIPPPSCSSRISPSRILYDIDTAPSSYSFPLGPVGTAFLSILPSARCIVSLPYSPTGPPRRHAYLAASRYRGLPPIRVPTTQTTHPTHHCATGTFLPPRTRLSYSE
jgi:hypothetical protein